MGDVLMSVSKRLSCLCPMKTIHLKVYFVKKASLYVLYFTNFLKWEVGVIFSLTHTPVIPLVVREFLFPLLSLVAPALGLIPVLCPVAGDPQQVLGMMLSLMQRTGRIRMWMVDPGPWPPP